MGDPTKPARQELGTEVWVHSTWDHLIRVRDHLGLIGLLVVPTTKAGKPAPVDPQLISKGRYSWHGRYHLTGGGGA
ncbi:hypothetical protein [Solwaraspora sp. WMMD792]|uniref:hypothetical protein n=1 Tax=Solwaraspora sp. WMMD792 TaxID=3016099 RepID=UPI002416C362|nr:hypothetical protein [Solwaraspora sp. WMMD792]MDG4768757.1 hypothetical protein [Solwaraspora sp. WMMD792]MDG4768796.1 hypothetical protein [Solwaraspora sp. WMMD792]MDG4768836.1 hypothetical protein [Solwaraspora sp. WMMD792]MDG4768848.1 hypothetical protein [Solwaraspora sp. WMMD792]MDG4768881.1 hypothetical protein [Solwaraspora sp. WMMD792]